MIASARAAATEDGEERVDVVDDDLDLAAAAVVRAVPETTNARPGCANVETLTPLTEPAVSPSTDVPLAIGSEMPSA